MNTAFLLFISAMAMAFACMSAICSDVEQGFLMWFQRSIAVASAIASMACLGLVIWRIAT